MRTAKVGDIFVLLTPPHELTEADFPWQLTWQATFGGRCTNPLHVSLQRFICPEEEALHLLIDALQSATMSLKPLHLTGVDLRPLYSSFRETYILKCRVRRDAPLEALDLVTRQTVLANGQQPHYRYLAVLVTVLEGIGKPQSLAPEPFAQPVPLFFGSRMVVSRVIGQESYQVIAEWSLNT